MRHVYLCLSGGSQPVFCAHQCTTSVLRIQICIICVCPEDPNLCSLMHHVCLEGPKSVSVLANAPHLSLSAWRVPICFLCSPMHHVCVEGPKSVSVLATAPRLCVCLEGPNLFLCSLMHHVCLSLSGGCQICCCACYCTTSICCPLGGFQICSLLIFCLNLSVLLLDL